MRLHVIWAGDSRVYLLDKNGLAQLSRDDLLSRDAFSNLSDDGAMTNVLAADGDFVLHHKVMEIYEPAIVFAASDGIFGYIQSPMEFEYILLDTILQSSGISELKENLKQVFGEYAADDYTFACMSFFCETYKNTLKMIQKRHAFLKKKYMVPIEDGAREDDEQLLELWEEYKGNYERFYDVEEDLNE